MSKANSVPLGFIKEGVQVGKKQPDWYSHEQKAEFSQCEKDWVWQIAGITSMGGN